MMALHGKSLSSASVAGPGIELKFDIPKSKASMSFTWTGTLPSGTILTFVNLEGTIDGVTWFAVSGGAPTVASSSFWGTSSNYVFTAIRANLINVDPGVTITAWLAAAE